MVGLFVVIAFCIFPTFLLAIMVVCVYYCLTEDPIPLSVLLRYLLSVDDDEHGHPDHYTMAQNRPVVQKKLIVRQVLEVLDKTDETQESEEPPRGHPFPITIVTEKKVLKYSAPLVFKDEEASNANENGGVPPPPISHAFRPAPPPPPVDEEVGIQLTPQPSPQSPSMHEARDAVGVENGDRSDEDAKDESGGAALNLELPSGSNDDGDGDEVHSTNSIQDHHKIDSLDKMEDGTEIDGGNLGDDEMDDPGKLPATDASLEDAPVTIGSNDDDENDDVDTVGDPDDHDEENPSVPPDDPPPLTTSMDTPPPIAEEPQPVQEQEQVEEEEKEVREVIHDDYFGINEQQDRGTTCDICLLEFEVDDMVAWSPNTECSHCFHKDCILDWLVRKHSCPSCRKDYLKGGKEENNAPASPNHQWYRTSAPGPPPPVARNNSLNRLTH